MKLSVVGVHRVPEAAEPCHLIELLIEAGSESLDIDSITQEVPGQDRADWQAPYDERVLAPDGSRVAFFFHYLEPNRPLLTQAGPIPLPGETPIPERLRFMKYEEP